MTITPSGAISLQNLATEFGGSVPHSLSEYYREGSLVTKNNTSVPTSGAIALGHFYSAVKEIQYTASNAASLNLSTAFGAIGVQINLRDLLSLLVSFLGL